jgi:hypothetical protein
MKTMTSNALRDLIEQKAGEVGITTLKSVEIADASSDDGEAYLRIVLRIDELKKTPLPELRRLIEAIEASLSEVDDRYPSVRFAEAA